MQMHVTKPDSPREIEAQLDRDRDALSATLDALRSRFSLDGLWSDGATMIKTNAVPYTHAIDAAVRANPLAIAITAVGLAWLILGRRDVVEPDPSSLAGTKFEAEARWEDEGGPVADLPETDAVWMEDADRLRVRAAAMIGRINIALRDNLAPAAELAKIRADVLAALAKDVRRTMARGLGSLTGSALETAMKARERSYIARVAAGKAGAEAVRKTPLVAGLALVAAGAAVAALIPQSALENQVLGQPRDRAMGEAKRVLQDERRRLSMSIHRIADVLAAETASPKTNSVAHKA